MEVVPVSSTTPGRGFRLLLGTSLLAGLVAVSTAAIGADEEDTEAGVGMDALAGLGADEGGGDSDRPSTGDLNDPLGGGTGGPSVEGETEETGTEPATTEGSDPTDPAAISANPMFKLMVDLIAADVQAAEAQAKADGRTLKPEERLAVAKGAARDLVTFLQQTGLLDEGASGDADANELLQQIMGIPTEE
jgi:hypothetical protein